MKNIVKWEKALQTTITSFRCTLNLNFGSQKAKNKTKRVAPSKINFLDAHISYPLSDDSPKNVPLVSLTLPNFVAAYNFTCIGIRLETSVFWTSKSRI